MDGEDEAVDEAAMVAAIATIMTTTTITKRTNTNTHPMDLARHLLTESTLKARRERDHRMAQEAVIVIMDTMDHMHMDIMDEEDLVDGEDEVDGEPGVDEEDVKDLVDEAVSADGADEEVSAKEDSTEDLAVQVAQVDSI